MIYIFNILIIALSLSVDAFVLSLSYSAFKNSKVKVLIISLLVGIFHFFMPLIGNIFGNKLFNYVYISPKIILFLVFLLLSIDMLLSFISPNKNVKKFSAISFLFFPLSVSFDSMSVGIGLEYLYDNILLCSLIFCFISFLITLLGFILGKSINNKLGKYAFLFSFLVLFSYSLIILTK